MTVIKRLSVLILVSYMGVVFMLSTVPDAGATHTLFAIVPNVIQKLGHLLAFGLLALLWIVTLRVHGAPERLSVCVALVVASGYGAVTELFQVGVPGRFPSMWDFMIDVSGILLFIWCYWVRWMHLLERLLHPQRPDA